MADEQNVVETIEQKKEPVNIWKILFICLVFIGIILFGCTNICNSDWYINKTLAIKEATDVSIGKNIKMTYSSKYDSGLLKMNITFDNIDHKVMDMIKNWATDDEEVITFNFVDKDNFQLTSKGVTYKELIGNGEQENRYDTRLALNVDKNTVKKIKYIKPNYIRALDMKHKDIIKEVTKRL